MNWSEIVMRKYGLNRLNEWLTIILSRWSMLFMCFIELETCCLYVYLWIQKYLFDLYIHRICVIWNGDLHSKLCRCNRSCLGLIRFPYWFVIYPDIFFYIWYSYVSSTSKTQSWYVTVFHEQVSNFDIIDWTLSSLFITSPNGENYQNFTCIEQCYGCYKIN